MFTQGNIYWALFWCPFTWWLPWLLSLPPVLQAGSTGWSLSRPRMFVPLSSPSFKLLLNSEHSELALYGVALLPRIKYSMNMCRWSKWAMNECPRSDCEANWNPLGKTSWKKKKRKDFLAVYILRAPGTCEHYRIHCIDSQVYINMLPLAVDSSLPETLFFLIILLLCGVTSTELHSCFYHNPVYTFLKNFIVWKKITLTFNRVHGKLGGGRQFKTL